MAVNLNITSTVKMLLQKFPETRDNDNLLILKIWAEQEPRLRGNGLTYCQFSILLLNGEISPPESIRRTRQQLQKEFIELQGKKYKARHKHQEVIIEQLHQPEMKMGGIP